MRPKRPVFGLLPTDSDLEAVATAMLAPPDAVSLVVTPNLDHVSRLRHDRSFRQAYAHAALTLCDGFPVQIYARLHAHRLKRVTGCDLVQHLLHGVPHEDPRRRWFFVVDNARTARAVRSWARRTAAGRVDVAVPPWGFIGDPAACAELAQRIKAHGTTLLVMAVGAPQSEIFVDRERDRLPPCWAICVGQAVKVALGLVRRAPPLLRTLHLEWLWRVGQEPRRLGRRYLLGAASFVLAVAEDLARPTTMQVEDA